MIRILTLDIKQSLLLIVFLLALPLSTLSAETSTNNDLVMTEIIFEEVEPGLEPFKSRLLLSKKMLRLDDDDDQGDYILYDREAHEIHSFNHEDKSHLMMKPLPVEVLDFEIDFKVESKPLTDAPKVNAVVPVQHQFFADKKLCKKSLNVKGLLPDLTQVLIDYEQVIVEQSKQTLWQIPADVRSSCYMSNNYLYASDYLKVGFPLFVTDDLGRQKKLLSFRQIKKDRSIMQQPVGYNLYYPNASNLPK